MFAPRLALVALGSLALAGCATKEVDASSAEKQIAGYLQTQLGAKPKVDCPGGQKPEKGTTFDCDIELRGQKGKAKVVMTAKDKFSFTVNGGGTNGAIGSSTTVKPTTTTAP